MSKERPENERGNVESPTQKQKDSKREPLTKEEMEAAEPYPIPEIPDDVEEKPEQAD